MAKAENKNNEHETVQPEENNKEDIKASDKKNTPENKSQSEQAKNESGVISTTEKQIKKLKKKKKPKKKHGFIRRFLSFERLKFKNFYMRKFRTLARIYKRIYTKKLNELQEKINFVNQCKDFFEQATEDTLQHKKEFMSRLEQYELDSMKLVEFFRMFERNKSDIENIAKKISKVEFKTMLDWNRKFKSKFDKLVK